MIQFDLPQTKSSIIKVFGIGGGGGNAVNYMHNQGIEGVDFVLCNTDVKALENSSIPLKVQIGPALTSGLGAGADPAVGQKATEESIAEITSILKDNTKMVFVTAGMGGGTGTGGAPIVAKVAKDLGILTVGIVTTPFSHEGRKRKQQAEEGIAKMRASVDTILVISNDKLRHAYGNLGFKEAFSKADNILATATRCITDVINSRGHVIVDFADVCTVMRDGGSAIFGNAVASGENRAMEAAEKAMNSPLLNDNDIAGAKWILLNINSSEGAHEHTLDEMDMIQNFIQEKAGDNCDVILGTGYDNTLGDQIGLTIIATGFNHNETKVAFDGEKQKPEDVKIIRDLNTTPESVIQKTETNLPNDDKEISAIATQTSHIEIITSLPQELMPTLVVEEISEPAIPTRPAMSMRPLQIVEVPTIVNIEPIVELSKPTTHTSFGAYISKPEQTVTDVPAAALPTNNVQDASANITFESVVKQSEEEEMITIDGITIARKLGSRYLTDDEIREKVNFELQKKAFDERASKLRGFNYNPTTMHGSDHLEEVPAYLRNNKTYVEQVPEANENLSNYTVDSQNGEINSKNKWLHNNTTTD
jgi:cell division protein FtsZ